MSLTSYRVLARKYRPTNFADLIGQEVMVRTLSNAITSGRLAHAFLLTGIRGVGKTTTARIIARALNCIGPDGTGTGPTTNPCGVCTHCVSIGEDRHMDVLEMDAASHTGVGDIRELIDTVHYLPSSARYKVYIIDEVHMLSTSAFNALLKTLEEPPPHVKFIFATTETRKIPVTILSRCQRFDLKRVEHNQLAGHLANIAAKENIEVEAEGLKLIAHAAEGSVRDSLSLLDQAIAHGLGQDSNIITVPTVRDMLGLADKSHLFDLLEQLFEGKTADVLQSFQNLYRNGADPTMLLQDLMELVHFITRIKHVPALEQDVAYSEVERSRSKELAKKLSMTTLTHCWQMLLKGQSEARFASHPDMAAEMVLLRIAHMAELPSPGEVVRSMSQNGETKPAYTPTAAPQRESNGGSSGGFAFQHNAALSVQTESEQSGESTPALLCFEDVVKLFEERREPVLCTYLKQDVRLVSFEQGSINISRNANVTNDFAGKVGRLLTEWTGKRWVVVISTAESKEKTLHEREVEAKAAQLEQAKAHPNVATILELFPGATVTRVKPNA